MNHDCCDSPVYIIKAQRLRKLEDRVKALVKVLEFYIEENNVHNVMNLTEELRAAQKPQLLRIEEKLDILLEEKEINWG